MLRQIAEFVAVLTCRLFVGAALYVSLVEHPAHHGLLRRNEIILHLIPALLLRTHQSRSLI